MRRARLCGVVARVAVREEAPVRRAGTWALDLVTRFGLVILFFFAVAILAIAGRAHPTASLSTHMPWSHAAAVVVVGAVLAAYLRNLHRLATPDENSQDE